MFFFLFLRTSDSVHVSLCSGGGSRIFCGGAETLKLVMLVCPVFFVFCFFFFFCLGLTGEGQDSGQVWQSPRAVALFTPPLAMVLRDDTNTLLHWSFPIRSDIARPVGSAISPRIGKDQCNNGFIFIPSFV